MADPRSRDEFLAARLADLAGHWLQVECGGCRARVFYPCPLLAKERGADLRVSDVLGRLRCRHCGGRPMHVAMTNDPTGGSQGGATMAWTVGLVP